MTDKVQRTVHIKWVRSGIGFDRSQSEVVRSLGLRRLNQVVERPDTPQVRGLVAKVAHLVEVVRAASEPVWNSTPSYAIKPFEPPPASEELNASASAPDAPIPMHSSEPDPVPRESTSASSSMGASPLSSERATASEGTVSSQNQGEKE